MIMWYLSRFFWWCVTIRARAQMRRYNLSHEYLNCGGSYRGLSPWRGLLPELELMDKLSSYASSRTGIEDVYPQSPWPRVDYHARAQLDMERSLQNAAMQQGMMNSAMTGQQMGMLQMQSQQQANFNVSTMLGAALAAQPKRKEWYV